MGSKRADYGSGKKICRRVCCNRPKSLYQTFRSSDGEKREKRDDPATIQNLMESMSETDRKVMNFFLSGRETFEKIMANDLIRCTAYLQKLEFVTKERIGVTGFCLG
jgi:dienelactone hydrolase